LLKANKGVLLRLLQNIGFLYWEHIMIEKQQQIMAVP
jgi:hypothetical protein